MERTGYYISNNGQLIKWSCKNDRLTFDVAPKNNELIEIEYNSGQAARNRAERRQRARGIRH